MHTGFLWIGSENESGVSGDSQLSSARRIVAPTHTTHTVFLWIGSENERGGSGDSQLSSARRIVAQAQPLQAHRLSPGIINRYKREQPLFGRMAVMFKRRVAPARPG